MESKAAQLRRRYPTVESLEMAAASCGGKTNLARSLGMERQDLNDHVKILKNGPKQRTKGPRVNNCDMTDKELGARIKEMFGGEYEKVTVYRLSDAYVSGQSGLEGLEFIRTETSLTAMALRGRGEG